MANIADGTYNALPDSAAVYEKNSKLVLECRFALCDEQGRVYEGVNKQSKKYWLTSADGAINTKTIAQIRKWAKDWDGTDPFWFCPQENPDGTTTPGHFADCGMVEITLKTEPYQAADGTTKNWQSIEWVNPIGAAGSGSKPIESGDRASIMAKYAAKFKAAATMTGTSIPTVRAAAPAPAAKKSARPAVPAKPAPAPAPAAKKSAATIPAGLAGQAVVWEKFLASMPAGIKDADRDEKWFAVLDKVAAGKDQQDFTSADWMNAAELIENPDAVDPDNLPF